MFVTLIICSLLIGFSGGFIQTKKSASGYDGNSSKTYIKIFLLIVTNLSIEMATIPAGSFRKDYTTEYDHCAEYII